MTDPFSKLKSTIAGYGKTLVCFSGGVDSTALAAISKQVLGPDAELVLVNVPMMSDRSRTIAEENAKALGMCLNRIAVDLSQIPEILENRENRCYICKKAIYSAALEFAEQCGFDTVVNGDNAGDAEACSRRPGMKAAEEFGIKSPLAESGIRKEGALMIVDALNLPNKLVKETCMLMRFPVGNPVTEDDLMLVEDVEFSIRQLSEVNQLRAYVCDNHKFKIQTAASEQHKLRDSASDIEEYLDKIGYTCEFLKEGYTE